MGAVAVDVTGSFVDAAGDRNVGAGMVGAVGRMAVGGRRRATSGACSNAGWGGSATVRGVAAGTEAGRGLSG